MNNMKGEYSPIVIVGGGIVGLTTAILLANSLKDLTITVIDSGTQTVTLNSHTHENRVFALSMATIRLLEQANVWSTISRKADYTGMKVWSENGVGELSFTTSESQSSEILGSMVEPSVILKALKEQLVNYPNIHICYQTKVADVLDVNNSYTDQHLLTGVHSDTFLVKWKLELEKTIEQQKHKKTNVYTSFVIACDGRQSTIRNKVGIDCDVLDYKKTAISCAVKTQKAHQQIARQIFLPTGPLAMLPLANIQDNNTQIDLVAPDAISLEHSNESQSWHSIVWTLPTNQALDLLSEPRGYLANKISQSYQYELGEVLCIGDVANFTLTAIHAQRYYKSRLVLLGDSAHGVHPLAGQGLNLGMLDVAVLTDLLISEYKRSGGLVLGSDILCAQYEQERKKHNAVMMHAFSMIGWLFSEYQFIAGTQIEFIKNEAMRFINKQSVLNAFFQQKATGMHILEKTMWH